MRCASAGICLPYRMPLSAEKSVRHKPPRSAIPPFIADKPLQVKRLRPLPAGCCRLLIRSIATALQRQFIPSSQAHRRRIFFVTAGTSSPKEHFRRCRCIAVGKALSLPPINRRRQNIFTAAGIIIGGTFCYHRHRNWRIIFVAAGTSSPKEHFRRCRCIAVGKALSLPPINRRRRNIFIATGTSYIIAAGACRRKMPISAVSAFLLQITKTAGTPRLIQCSSYRPDQRKSSQVPFRTLLLMHKKGLPHMLRSNPFFFFVQKARQNPDAETEPKSSIRSKPAVWLFRNAIPQPENLLIHTVLSMRYLFIPFFRCASSFCFLQSCR